MLNLDKRIFWDVDYSKIDWEKNAPFVIVRVFERGDIEDIRQVRRYYGDDKLRDSLTTAKWLRLQTIYFACALLNNNLSDYRCYTQAQSNQQHWIY